MSRFSNITYTQLLTVVKYKPQMNNDQSRQIHADTIMAYYLIPFVIEKILGESHPELPAEVVEGMLCCLHYPSEDAAIQKLNNDLAELQKAG